MKASTKALLERRERLLGPGNPLFYDDPVHLVKGEGVWVFDADGRRYLDCYNNVPCVGHCHPHVVDALCRQAKTLNTHTRYLHENILDYAEHLLSYMDESLNRVLFACTGSEANEIALRIARACTGREGFICTNATYHGNTTAVAQLSSIFEPLEGYGPNIRMVPWPDSYRALNGLQGERLADAYADTVRQAIDSLEAAGIKLAAMLVCPIFANEGLPDVPPTYLEKAVAHVRNAGGLYIADEVQSGFGRTGTMFAHGEVVPDIMTLGKPMGAGHPLSGVVARGDLVAEFRERVMYFNTFGGNPVSCAVGKAVLEVLENENLVESARDVGSYVVKGFNRLKDKHSIIGDVRGCGLFFGVDLVTDRQLKTPAANEAKHLVNRMREKGVLMSKIGEHDNVLKLRPPLPFSKDNADQLMHTLDEVLGEL
ncbi:MAG: aminotransferase class III-fold pyridoxal phosphate-dependent enzyme [Pseudomonadota bacterium]